LGNCGSSACRHDQNQKCVLHCAIELQRDSLQKFRRLCLPAMVRLPSISAERGSTAYCPIQVAMVWITWLTFLLLLYEALVNTTTRLSIAGRGS
jgi:hypothetical protein